MTTSAGNIGKKCLPGVHESIFIHQKSAFHLPAQLILRLPWAINVSFRWNQSAFVSSNLDSQRYSTEPQLRLKKLETSSKEHTRTRVKVPYLADAA